MVTPIVALATEDELSERVCERLLAEAGLAISELRFRKNGFGYLKSKIDNFVSLARHQPLLLLTDLDQLPCAPTLIQRWMGKNRAPENLILRVAVRQVEAWILADGKAITDLLGRRCRPPSHPEDLPDSKRHLLELARLAPRAIRDDLVAAKGAIASQGLGYNSVLSNLVSSQWCPKRAAMKAPSLARARNAIGRLANRLAS